MRWLAVALMTLAAGEASTESLSAHFAAMSPPLAQDVWTIHDPSRIVETAEGQMIAATARAQEDGYACGLETWVRDSPGDDWTPGDCLFLDKPAWVAEELPTNDGAFWAPDLLDPDTLVYSVSAGDMEPGSCTGLALRRDGTWHDIGAPLTCSFTAEGAGEVAAIDPTLLRTSSGDTYLIIGGGVIHATRIEITETAATLVAPDWFTPGAEGWTTLARGPDRDDEAWVEAAYVHEHDGWFFLFVNWGTCCSGIASTYEIRMGRSRDPLGPYLDAEGRDLREGGGTLLLGTRGARIGPGHASIRTDADGQDHLGYHFYDADRDGLSWMAETPLDWSDGWPRAIP
jgi:arabinan endo-1,5-alpha-L-arabinosidase